VLSSSKYMKDHDFWFVITAEFKAEWKMRNFSSYASCHYKGQLQQETRNPKLTNDTLKHLSVAFGGVYTFYSHTKHCLFPGNVSLHSYMK